MLRVSLNKLALVALSLCPTVDPQTIRKYLTIWSDYASAWEGLNNEMPPDCPIQLKSYRSLMRWRQAFSLEQVRERLQSDGISIIVQGADNYPENLNHLTDPPLVLFAKGHLDLIHEYAQSVAIVGTRRASGYALEATTWIADVLARSGHTIVSGLAIGIDGQAHRAALAANGKTIAVLGAGIDKCYPPAHQEIYHRICDQGLLLSEYPPQTIVAKHRFPARNRLIAALSKRVVVVQAGDRSGALRTADIALELGRDVFAVPGPITATHHRGSNRLLQEGAGVITEPADLLPDRTNVDSEPQAEPQRWTDLYQVLTSPQGAQALAVALALPISQVYAGLLELELDGWIERLPGSRYQQRRPQRVSSAP